LKRAVLVVLLAMIAFAGLAENQPEKEKPPETIPALQQQLEKLLQDTHTPGMSVAIVRRDGPEWVAGLGTADVATHRPATSGTLFRIGSTSKAFAAFSILLLVNQGKLSLDDPVHKLVPEMWFYNRWEASDPVRVVNLLEHTTGWDDMHLREYAKDAPPGMSLREALGYDHHSRISRWPPGTRMSYCNSGPAVAAYIVEKLTNQRFEDFVQQNLFRPIGMKTATYFPPAPGTAATLYHDDGKTAYPYWNILLRPAGAINASATDMAAYLEFCLHRGMVNGIQVVSAEDIDRMESPTSSWAAKEGLKAGYGLGNYWTVQDGFVYHGHNGGVAGGLTDMAYMPAYGVGYFFSINSGDSQAFARIDKSVRGFITAKLQKPPLPAVAPLPPDAADYSGWYEPDSPRIELTHFLDRLAGLCRVRFRDGKLVISTPGKSTRTFVPVAGSQFRYVPKKGPADPVPTLALLIPNQEGRFIQLGIMTTLKRIPAWEAYLEMGLTLFSLLSVVAILVYAPFWILGGLSKKRRRPAERGMRIWPLIAVLSLLSIVVIFAVGSSDVIPRFGNLTGWSAALFLATIAFAAATLAGVVTLLRVPGQAVRRGVRGFSLVVTAALLMTAAYLAFWGIIGLRTWV
jgi:CubicO group peptidase (beta-lactamase class C family)